MTIFKLNLVVDGEHLDFAFADEKVLNSIVAQINEGGNSLLQLNDGNSISFIRKSAVSLMKVKTENVVTDNEQSQQPAPAQPSNQ